MFIHIVGCGALGSEFILEFCKRAFATDLCKKFKIRLYDFDTVENRNCGSQAFHPDQIGLNKAIAMRDMVSSYEINVTAIPMKIESIEDFKCVQEGDAILIDLVDNIKTRQNLCLYGQALGIPTLHAGIGLDGSGYVNWTFKEFSSFPLSPDKLEEKTFKYIEEMQKVKLPPCELNGMRYTILSTALLAVQALYSYLGEGVEPTQKEQGKMEDYFIAPKGYKKTNEYKL